MRRFVLAAVLVLSAVLVLRSAGPSAASRPARPADDPPAYTLHLPVVASRHPPVPYLSGVIQLPAGSHPHGLAIDEAGQRVFVGNHWANTLSVIDAASLTVSATIPLPNATGPNGVAYLPGRDRVYVANRDSNNLSVVDPTAGSIVTTQNVGYLPDGVAVMDDLVYVANFGANSVSILDAALNTVTRTFAIGSEPALFAVLDEYETIYLTSHGNATVYALKDAAYYNSTPGVAAPYGLSIDPITYRLYAANRGEAHTVTLIDVNPNAVAGVIDVGGEPHVLAINPRTGHLFVVCGDVVRVYDRRDHALITAIPIGPGATEGIAVDPAHNRVYVSSSDVDQINVIQDVPALDLAYVTYRLSANQQPQSDIFIADDAGRHVSQLTHAAADLELNAQPVFRPDGKRLAFVSSRDDVDHNWNVFTMDLTGRNQINLTADGGVEDTEPAWSPDGTRLAWRRDWNIWVMNADGSGKTQLTTGLTARTPQWSPDGQWINFIAFPPGETHYVDVYIVSAGGGSPLNLTDSPRNDLQASWSPDSRYLAFETDRHSVFTGTQVITPNWEIYTVDISATLQTRLTDDPDQDHAAAWSPDGAHIAWASDRGAEQYDFRLWLMTSAGGDQHLVAGVSRLLFPIRWSPDGRRVAVQSGLLQNGDIVVIDTVTGAIQPVTHTPLEEAWPVWRPDTWR